MGCSICPQWHPQSAFNGTTAVILIGCAPTHLHPAFNGTINPPAMAPLLSKLQQCHHRCHPHRLCANSCSICPQWHPQSAFNGTTRPLSSSLAVRQHIFIPPSTAPSIRQQWHHRCHPHRLCANSCSICPQWHPQSAFNGTTAVILIGCAPTHLHPAFNGTINPPATAPSLSNYSNGTIAVILIGCAPTHVQSALNGTLNPPSMAPPLSSSLAAH